MANYHEDVRVTHTIRLRERLKELPSFMNEFFRGLADYTSARTRIGYAYDLKIFFNFLVTETQTFRGQNVKELRLNQLELITSDHIERFMEHLSYYRREQGKDTKNEENGKSRKLAAIRTMFSYFLKRQKISVDPSAIVDFPKTRNKIITRLESHEVKRLLDEVENGEHLTPRQKAYHDYTKTRDLAIVSLLLGTGMRVSECVGIDLKHLDFEANGVKITRKGGDESRLYFGEEVALALSQYITERQRISPLEGHEDALFLSIQRKRMTDRSIQNIVKKYSQSVITVKKVSPHKLRSTFGTNLYKASGDIYLVADVLGHSDVNTARKHYVHMDDERRKEAAGFVKLREE